MKVTNKHYFFIFAAFLVATVGVFEACKSPFEDVRLKVNTDLFTSPILITFQNANTGSSAKPTITEISIAGKDADKILTDVGTKTFKVTNGVLTLALNPKTLASQQNPVEFTIYAKADGFLDMTQNVTITGNNVQRVAILGVEKNNPPKGVAVTEQQDGIENGISTTELVIQSGAGNGKPEKAKITIDNGTEFRDANGQLISGASLSSILGHFSTAENASQLAFPGGFVANDVVNNDGTPTDDLTFKTAGFMALDMKVGNTEVKSFSKPIHVEMDVRSEVVNLSTGEAVKEGDKIPVWSLDQKTGRWRAEGEANIIKDGDGTLKAGFDAPHLSWWNLDWWAPDCPGNTLTVNVTSPITSQDKDYEVQIQTPDGQYLAGLHSQVLYNGLSFTIHRMPDLPQVKIVVYDFSQCGSSSIVATTNLFNPCSQGTIGLNVDVPAASAADRIGVQVNLEVECAAQDITVFPSCWVQVYEKDANFICGGDYFYAYLVNGQFGSNVPNGRLDLKKGATYVVIAYYNGNFYPAEFVADPAAAPVPLSGGGTVSGSSGSLTGTYNYDAANKLATINAKWISNDCVTE